MQAYLFNDYWEDIGTIKSFFEANLALAAQVRSSQALRQSKEPKVGACNLGPPSSFCLPAAALPSRMQEGK